MKGKIKMKRVISMILAMMLVLGLAVSASAATAQNDTTHDYKAYQIFSGSQNAYDANLANPQWGTGVNGSALLAALQADDVTKSYFTGIADDAEAAQHVVDVLSDKTIPSYVIGQFAQLAYDNRTAVATDIPASATNVDLAAGYYLIVDVTDESAGDALNPALLQVTNAGPIHIQKKYDLPEPDKNVIADDTGDTTDHVKKEDTPVGKTVEFHLKAELPGNMTGYRKYKAVFHDSMTEGLTLNESSIQVTLNGTPVDAAYYNVEVISTPTADTCDKDDADKFCDFHVTIPDVMAIPGFVPGCELIVKYTATVNDDAVKIEYNDFRFEYSNDPNDDPDDPSKDPTGIFPWKEVEVHHTGIEVRKTDGATDQPLTGAQFKLTGVSNQRVKVTKNEFVEFDPATEPEVTKYWKLKDGSYTTLDPAAPESNPDLYVAPVGGVYTVYKAVTSVTMEPVEGAEVSVTAEVGPDGTVKFDGLGEGVYTLTETVSPAGYNGLKGDITVTVVFHEATGKWDITYSGAASGSGDYLVVENFKGSVLPETGGIGTTLFYAIGGLMVAAAAVLLVTKKRMTAE